MEMDAAAVSAVVSVENEVVLLEVGRAAVDAVLWVVKRVLENAVSSEVKSWVDDAVP
jgi:hypothetical protein